VSDPNSPQYGSPQYGDPYGGPPAPQYGSPPPPPGQYGVPQQPQYGGPPQPPEFGGPPPAPYGGPPVAPPPPVKKSGGAKKIIFSVLGIIVALCVAVGVKAAIGGGLSSLFGDSTSDAKAGDCIADLESPPEGETVEANNARVVDCNSTDAKFKVVGRVDNKTEAEFNADDAGDLKICTDAGFNNAEAEFWSGREGGTGYILCLIAWPAVTPSTTP